MKRVTGLGGVFLKCDDPKKMYDWYSQHLGLQRMGIRAKLWFSSGAIRKNQSNSE